MCLSFCSHYTQTLTHSQACKLRNAKRFEDVWCLWMLVEPWQAWKGTTKRIRKFGSSVYICIYNIVNSFDQTLLHYVKRVSIHKTVTPSRRTSLEVLVKVNRGLWTNEMKFIQCFLMSNFLFTVLFLFKKQNIWKCITKTRIGVICLRA